MLFGGTLIWAFTAKIDQTVTVRGRLEPSGSVRSVDSLVVVSLAKFLSKKVTSLNRENHCLT